MLTVSGDMWLQQTIGNAWVKHVRSHKDLDLTQSGAYAFKCGFQSITQPIELHNGECLLVAAQRQKASSIVYSSILVFGDKASQEITKLDTIMEDDGELLRDAFREALQRKLVPASMFGNKQNKLYLMAVACAVKLFRRGQWPAERLIDYSPPQPVTRQDPKPLPFQMFDGSQQRRRLLTHVFDPKPEPTPVKIPQVRPRPPRKPPRGFYE